MTARWSAAPFPAAERAASAISVRSGTIRKFDVVMASDYAQSYESRIDGIRALNSARGSSLEISSFVYAAIEMHIVFRNRNDLNFVGCHEFSHQPLQREIASGQSCCEM